MEPTNDRTVFSPAQKVFLSLQLLYQLLYTIMVYMNPPKGIL